MTTFDEQNIQKSIDELRTELAAFCEQFSIKRFEPDDIVELLEDGEEIEWIIEQLKHDNEHLAEETAAKILTEIRDAVAKPEDGASAATTDSDESSMAAALEISPEEAQSQQIFDINQIDFNELESLIEQMTGGPVDQGALNQIKKMMQGDQGKLMTDFALWCQEQDIDIAVVTDEDRIKELNQQWAQTPRLAFDGKTPAEVVKAAAVPGLTKVETYHRETPKVGRNAPCPCGSGKKYKKCCGRNL